VLGEGIWSLLKRAMANFAATDLDALVRIVKRKVKKIQHRPHLIDGCLAGTGDPALPPDLLSAAEYEELTKSAG
jgi:hypothetical protein